MPRTRGVMHRARSSSRSWRRPTAPAACSAPPRHTAPPTHYPEPALGRSLRVTRWAMRVVGFVIPVHTPLPDVAVQVVQAEVVGRVRTHPRGLVQDSARGTAPVRVAAVEVGLLRGE